MVETKRNQSPCKASLTRRQYLFHEMRAAARLAAEKSSDKEIIQIILSENLFQYPTEKSIKDSARICIRRLRGSDDPALARAVADSPADVAKQICFHAIMKQSRLETPEDVEAYVAKVCEQLLKEPDGKKPIRLV